MTGRDGVKVVAFIAGPSLLRHVRKLGGEEELGSRHLPRLRFHGSHGKLFRSLVPGLTFKLFQYVGDVPDRLLSTQRRKGFFFQFIFVLDGMVAMVHGHKIPFHLGVLVVFDDVDDGVGILGCTPRHLLV